MRRLALLLMAVLALGLMHEPESHAACNGFAVPNNPFAFEQITVSNAAIGFTTATYSTSATTKANYAIVTTETNPIRFRADGTNPTAAIGHLVQAGNTIEVCGTFAVTNMKMIRQGAADATVNVTYYRGD